MRPGRPSPAVLIAGLALLFALGGSAVAARRYLITSTGQIKPSVLHKLHGARGPAGPAGAPGVPGPAGSQGPAGPAGPVELGPLAIARAPDVLVAPQTEMTSVASCPDGSHVVSGGAWTGVALVIYSEMSDDHQSWITLVFNNNSVGSKIATNLEAIAYCALSGRAVAASFPAAAHRRAVAQARLMLARARRERGL
jgi:hypothetical protein